MIGRGGLPQALAKKRRRIGLMAGLLLGVILTCLASHVLWDVRIEGGDGRAMPHLREQLAACGLEVGAWLPSLDTDRIESQLLLDSGEVAWVSVNVRGTVAYVQVRALVRPQRAVSEQTSNLVAACDGVIDSVRLLSGQVVVKSGELVRRGQLLVSGVRDSSATGYGVSAAQGEVMARVEDTICVQIPRVQTQKRYTERQNVQKTLIFFGKSIKLSKNTTTEGQNCDIIKEIEDVILPGGAPLPISLEREVALCYESVEHTLDDEALTERAYEMLGLALTVATEGAMLVSKQVTSELTDEGILLVCRYECIKNIAVSRPLSVTAE
jgi:similar to stage IV sporulation protein